jgi:hypothetical protein
MRAVIADRMRSLNTGVDLDFASLSDARVLDMDQYNVFPNITVLVFSDMLNVVRARPGASVGEAWMDAYLFQRRAAGDESPRTQPFEMVVGPDDDVPLGLVLGQDVANFARAQKGMAQPGLTHLTVSSTEECRILNLHKNLDEYLG